MFISQRKLSTNRARSQPLLTPAPTSVVIFRCCRCAFEKGSWKGPLQRLPLVHWYFAKLSRNIIWIHITSQFEPFSRLDGYKIQHSPMTSAMSKPLFLLLESIFLCLWNADLCRGPVAVCAENSMNDVTYDPPNQTICLCTSEIYLVE